MPDAPAAVILAHGAPADPEPQEAVLRGFAARVAEGLPGWTVRGATLATGGALEAALAGLAAPFVYPLFIAEGWFTGSVLPRRVAGAGARDARHRPPFGVEPELPALMARAAREGARAAGMEPGEVALMLAAHGARRPGTASASTHAMAAALARTAGFARVLPGFVEETPTLAEAARDAARGVCLPFFVLAAGHVTDDLPPALAEAGFDGPLLPPIGLHPDAPALVARSLARAARSACPPARRETRWQRDTGRV